MIDIFEKIGLAIIGGLIVWIGTYLSDRRRRKDNRSEILRQAYSEWFSSYAIFAKCFQFLASSGKDVLSNLEQHDSVMRKVNAAEGDVKSVDIALNNVLFLETDESFREPLIKLSELIENTYEFTRKMSIHYGVHLEDRERRDQIRRKMEEETNEEKLLLMQKQVDLITEWDEKCKVITPESIQSICNMSKEIKQLSDNLRSALIKRSLI